MESPAPNLPAEFQDVLSTHPIAAKSSKSVGSRGSGSSQEQRLKCPECDVLLVAESQTGGDDWTAWSCDHPKHDEGNGDDDNNRFDHTVPFHACPTWRQCNFGVCVPCFEKYKAYDVSNPHPDKLDGPYKEKAVTGGYAYYNGRCRFDDFDEAIAAAVELYPACRGITIEPGYDSDASGGPITLRAGTDLVDSEHDEISFILLDPNAPPPSSVRFYHSKSLNVRS